MFLAQRNSRKFNLLHIQKVNNKQFYYFLEIFSLSLLIFFIFLGFLFFQWLHGSSILSWMDHKDATETFTLYIPDSWSAAFVVLFFTSGTFSIETIKIPFTIFASFGKLFGFLYIQGWLTKNWNNCFHICKIIPF